MRRNSWLVNTFNSLCSVNTAALWRTLREPGAVRSTKRHRYCRATDWACVTRYVVTTLHDWRKRLKYGTRNMWWWRRRGSTERHCEDCRKANGPEFPSRCPANPSDKVILENGKSAGFWRGKPGDKLTVLGGQQRKSIGQLLHLGGILISIIAGAALWWNFDGKFGARAWEARNNVEFAHELNVFCTAKKNHRRTRHCWPVAGTSGFILTSSQQYDVQGLEL